MRTMTLSDTNGRIASKSASVLGWSTIIILLCSWLSWLISSAKMTCAVCGISFLTWSAIFLVEENVSGIRFFKMRFFPTGSFLIHNFETLSAISSIINWALLWLFHSFFSSWPTGWPLKILIGNLQCSQMKNQCNLGSDPLQSRITLSGSCLVDFSDLSHRFSNMKFGLGLSVPNGLSKSTSFYQVKIVGSVFTTWSM